MQLYADDQHEVPGMDEVELQHLGHQLVDFVTTYRKMIRIVTPDVDTKLNTLYDVGMVIIHRQYHLLFNDPSVVIPSGISLSDYQEMLEESLGYPF